MLNVFVRIVFSKTQAHDSIAVIRTLNIVTEWLTKIHCNRALIPPDFDWIFFFKGIKILLELDHGTSTAKVIWMLY